MAVGNLTDEEKKTLLDLARATLEAYTRKGRAAGVSMPKLTDALREKRGAFVTLTERGQLRGCIGYVEPMKALWETVMENAVNAGFRDPRFPPVHADELTRIRIEISAMTPCEEIKDLTKVNVGEHGLMISLGHCHGLLLPQVATEYGWTREEFLKFTCRKAGLPDDACYDPDAKVEVFCAEVFHEAEPDV